MYINPFAFVGLVLLAIVGGVCIGVAVGFIVWFVYELRKDNREQKRLKQKIEEARNWEYDQMKQNLFKFFEDPGQGASV